MLLLLLQYPSTYDALTQSCANQKSLGTRYKYHPRMVQQFPPATFWQDCFFITSPQSRENGGQNRNLASLCSNRIGDPDSDVTYADRFKTSLVQPVGYIISMRAPLRSLFWGGGKELCVVRICAIATE